MSNDINDPSNEPLVLDATPVLDPDSFDVDSWLDGIEPTTRAVKVYRKPQLLGRVDELMGRLRVAESIPEDDRAMSDESPASIRQELNAVAEEFEASGRWWKVAARSDDRVQAVKDAARAADKNISDHEVELHLLADAIVEPVGVTVAHLRKLSAASEIQVKQLVVARSLANNQPPQVDVPFSPSSSGGRRQRG